MALILNIESSSTICSVSLAKDGQSIALRESKVDKTHATLLTVFIDELFREQKITAKDLDAIAVSEGPGSYTGLRIGVSTAKGLAYGANVPLIAIKTLQMMTAGFLSENSALNDKEVFCPMIDARRMEVYTEFYDKNLNCIREVKPEIIEENAFAEYHNQTLVFFGYGADKCEAILAHPNFRVFKDFEISATFMAPLSEALFQAKSFVSVAYFEPFYLKEFKATTPKNSVLGKL